MAIQIIRPQWPAPDLVQAAVSTRPGGVSVGPYQALNVAGHVGDRQLAVRENRNRLVATLSLACQPHWLDQVHGTKVIDLDVDEDRVGDAAVTARAGQVAAVMTADCLPVLFCDRRGTRVGVAHGGWRGLAAGVLQATLTAMEQPPSELLVWLGPAISQMAYQVDRPVREAFVSQDSGHDACFLDCGEGRWQANLYALARRILKSQGVVEIYGGGFCTYYDQHRFFSHRRDGPCGRMATLIWLQGPR